MICRIWNGQAKDADAYETVFRTEVLDELGAVPGFRGAYLLKGDAGEVIALTLFDTLDDVRAFAGEDYDKANVSQPARAVLSTFDSHARHYRVVVTPADSAG